jgi:hypothetical protein
MLNHSALGDLQPPECGGLPDITADRYRKTDHPLWLLKRLDKSIEQDPIEAAIVNCMLSLWC